MITDPELAREVAQVQKSELITLRKLWWLGWKRAIDLKRELDDLVALQ